MQTEKFSMYLKAVIDPKFVEKHFDQAFVNECTLGFRTVGSKVFLESPATLPYTLSNTNWKTYKTYKFPTRTKTRSDAMSLVTALYVR